MNSILDAILNLKTMDEMASDDTIIHRLHPLFKLICAFLLIVFTLTSFHITELLAYCFVVFMVGNKANIPAKKIMTRSLLGLPLCLCMGLSYLIFNRAPINFYGIYIAEGILLFIFLTLKTFITLALTYILISTTKFDDLASALVQIKVPSIFVLQLTMTYRYIFTLLEDARNMSQAYILRSPQAKALDIKHMGSFVGHLLVKSMDDSSRVYEAMKCRGFNPLTSYNRFYEFKSENYFLLMMVLGVLIILKVVCI